MVHSPYGLVYYTEYFRILVEYFRRLFLGVEVNRNQSFFFLKLVYLSDLSACQPFCVCFLRKNIVFLEVN